MNANHESFTPHDPAGYLGRIEDVASYLKATIDEGGDVPAVITRALGVITRSGNISELARRTGMSREGLQGAVGRQPSQLGAPGGDEVAHRRSDHL